MNKNTDQLPASTEAGAPPFPDDADSSTPEGAARLRADAARNRERVVAAATELFAEEGISVSMEVIAKRAEVGVGTIYRQFPKKEDLFLAVVHDEAEQMCKFAKQLERTGDPGAALNEFVFTLLDTVASKRDLAQALERSGLKAKETPELQKVWRAALEGLVDQAKKSGAVRSDLSVDDVLFLISGTCSAVVNHGPDHEARMRMGRVLCDGFRRAPDAEPQP